MKPIDVSNKPSSKKRVIVLISGSGSNLQALIDATHSGYINAEIVAVISNRPNVYGLIRAEQSHIPSCVIDHTQFPNRETFDEAVSKQINQYQPDLIVLAGYMRILTPKFVQSYLGRLLNIHPSLLPKYPGLHTYQKALEAGDSEHGTTVHFVTEELDGGPIILQARVNIEPEDNEESLRAKVILEEHKIYPEVVKWFCDERLEMKDNRAYLDGEVLS